MVIKSKDESRSVQKAIFKVIILEKIHKNSSDYVKNIWTDFQQPLMKYVESVLRL